jgi:beta-fructofuranosidase
MIEPDGIQYVRDQHKNWRDPYVFWNDEEQQYWMVVIASNVENGNTVQGLLTSKNLKTWSQEPPLKGAEGQECPDLFKIGDYYYLIGGGHYASSKNIRGPYTRKGNSAIDNPGVYAGKRMFDGKRHIWVGWAWDTADMTDDDRITWGGYMCSPRELYAGPEGQLYCRPASEVTAVFSHKIFDIKTDRESVATNAAWDFKDDELKGVAQGQPTQCLVDLPVGNYMLECEIQLDPQAEFTLHLREQVATGEGYFLRIRPKEQQIDWGSRDLNGKEFTWSRACEIDPAEPIKIQAFMQGTVMECFVNDAYAFTRRAYNFEEGLLGLEVSGGSVVMNSLSVMTHESNDK